jgi:hypothetical protein
MAHPQDPSAGHQNTGIGLIVMPMDNKPCAAEGHTSMDGCKSIPTEAWWLRQRILGSLQVFDPLFWAEAPPNRSAALVYPPHHDLAALRRADAPFPIIGQGDEDRATRTGRRCAAPRSAPPPRRPAPVAP